MRGAARAAALGLVLGVAQSLVHHLHIRNDGRSLFKIETFGFVSKGHMNLAVDHFHLNSAGADPQVGFVLRKASSESAAQQDLEKLQEQNKCILDTERSDDVVLDMSDKELWKEKQVKVKEVDSQGAGLYTLIFARCSPSGAHEVTFDLDAEFYNPGPDYLSAGDSALPSVYTFFACAFLLTLVAWGLVLLRSGGKVHTIHYMMAALLVLKTITLGAEAIRYHYISRSGEAEAWSIVYYIFAFFKSAMLFTVILLIGTGWSLMKSYLNDREKKIIWVVLSLQVLDNVAMVVLEETAPGSQGWVTWRDVLHLVDIVCCCFILFPIVWSIRHLREAAEVDGKAQHNMEKLKLFRSFYLIIVSYIYFTRIVVFLLEATLPFHLLWLGVFFTELATLLFFVVTGFKFRPAENNPYLSLRTEEQDLAEEGEYGLEDEVGTAAGAGKGVELSTRAGGATVSV